MVVGFLGDLWRSIFEPGSSPAVVKATHVSFFFLVSILLVMLFLTRSIHFVFLLILSVALWITTAWFIDEYNRYLREQEKDISEAAPKISDAAAADCNSTSSAVKTTHRPSVH